LLFILFALTLNSYAQTYQLENLSTRNGLPNNSIRDIYKDNSGAIWLGTDAGLCKYNGNDIEIYTTKNGLSGNKIWNICQDKHGILWFATYDNGISYYNGKTFKTLLLNDSISKHVRNVVYSPEYDCLLFGTDNGIIAKYQDTILYFDKSTINEKQFLIVNMKTMGDGFVIYSYRNTSPHFFNLKTRQFSDYNKFSNKEAYNISCSIVDKHSDTLIGYKRNYVALIKKDSLIRYTQTGQVFDMILDKNNDAWFASWDISLNNSNGGLFKLLNDSLIDYTDIFNLPTRSIWTLYYDSLEDIFYIGTDGKDLFIYKNTTFQYFDLGLGNLQVNYMKWIDSTLWIGEEEHLILFNSSHNFKAYNTQFFKTVNRNTDINRIKAFNKDKRAKLSVQHINTDKGNIYISSQAGFYKYNGANNFSLLSFNRFLFIFNNNKFYCVGWSQLFESSIINGVIQNKRHAHSFKKEKTPIDIQKIVEHNGKTWFLSTSRGLFVLDNNHYYWLKEKTKDLDDQINDIAFDSSNNIYIAQNNGELLVAKLDKDSLIIQQKLSCNSEIRGNVINWLACNKHNQLFVGTDQGLNYINLTQNNDWSFRFYNQKEGYTAFESTNAVADSIGNIWVDTHKGLLKLQAFNFKNITKYQEFKIIGFDIFNINSDSLLQESSLNLAYNKNNLRFYFGRNNYTNADKDIYYYRLKGLSEQWQSTNTRKADFFNLANGKYTFEVKCLNTNTNQYSNTASFTFSVNKPWWNSTVFYIISILLFAILLWFYIKIRIKKVKQEAEKTAEISKKISEMEMKALQSQMNPHFVFNSINSIQNFVLDGNIDDTLTYLAHFSRLLRSTLNYASEKYISVEQEKEFLSHYIALEKMRFENDKENAFDIQFVIDENIDESAKIIPPMLLQPIIENSIKHGEIHKLSNGKITIEIKQENNILICAISDNGIGRVKAEKKQNKHHHSKAMGIISDRIKLLSTCENTGMQIIDLEQGTRVELRIAIDD